MVLPFCWTGLKPTVRPWTLSGPGHRDLATKPQHGLQGCAADRCSSRFVSPSACDWRVCCFLSLSDRRPTFWSQATVRIRAAHARTVPQEDGSSSCAGFMKKQHHQDVSSSDLGRVSFPIIGLHSKSNLPGKACVCRRGKDLALYTLVNLVLQSFSPWNPQILHRSFVFRMRIHRVLNKSRLLQQLENHKEGFSSVHGSFMRHPRKSISWTDVRADPSQSWLGWRGGR